MTLQQALSRAAQHEQKGELADAESLYQQILGYEPKQIQAIYGLCGLSLRAARNTQALELIQRALSLRPDEPSFLGTLGIILIQLGRADEAIAAFERALELRADFPELHYELGNAWLGKGQAQQAIPFYRRALELRLDYPEAISNLANALTNSGDLDGAITLCREALTRRPDFAIVRRNLAWALRESARIEQAIACLREGLAVQPDPKLHSDLLFALHFHPDYDRHRLAREHSSWYEIHARPLATSAQPHENEPQPDRRLRVGYVAHDLGNLPLGRFLLPLLTHHNQAQFEAFCYCNLLAADPVGEALQRHVSAWRSTGRMTDQQVAQLVRQDRIDILVDLTLHTNGNRLLMFARKPAPVQVTYLAYCSTTGLKEIDYRFTDGYLDPAAEDDRLYAEASVRLPHYWCYPAPPEAPPVAALPALRNGFVTFGSLNDFAKTSPELLAAWSGLLRRTSGSRLILHSKQGSHRQEVPDRFRQEGIAPDRVRFVGRMSLDTYFATYNQIDIGLDPFAWSGGITSCDALWMGVPVVSLAGDRAVARGGLSILANVGLSELVVDSVAKYVQIAVDLANDVSRLSSLRNSLRQRIEASPLMDAARFARSVESAYRRMWQRWCDKQFGES